MADDFTLATFYRLWREYAGHIREAIAPLTAEQAALRAAPGQRTIGELVAHVIVGRVYWLGEFVGETDDDFTTLQMWDNPGELTTNIPDLLNGLDHSWQFVERRLARWTPADMQQTFPHEWRGDYYDLSRSWVLWHVLEHDLHHGGEISLTLGMHGLQAPDI